MGAFFCLFWPNLIWDISKTAYHHNLSSVGKLARRGTRCVGRDPKRNICCFQSFLFHKLIEPRLVNIQKGPGRLGLLFFGEFIYGKPIAHYPEQLHLIQRVKFLKHQAATWIYRVACTVQFSKKFYYFIQPLEFHPTVRFQLMLFCEIDNRL